MDFITDPLSDYIIPQRATVYKSYSAIAQTYDIILAKATATTELT
ncbi:MAG: hypothetical protein ACLR23_02475 [Clostridia bacterium]|nr:hypothetical protein [Bianquea renquensis]